MSTSLSISSIHLDIWQAAIQDDESWEKGNSSQGRSLWSSILLKLRIQSRVPGCCDSCICSRTQERSEGCPACVVSAVNRYGHFTVEWLGWGLGVHRSLWDELLNCRERHQEPSTGLTLWVKSQIVTSKHRRRGTEVSHSLSTESPLSTSEFQIRARNIECQEKGQHTSG